MPSAIIKGLPDLWVPWWLFIINFTLWWIDPRTIINNFQFGSPLADLWLSGLSCRIPQLKPWQSWGRVSVSTHDAITINACSHNSSALPAQFRTCTHDNGQEKQEAAKERNVSKLVFSAQSKWPHSNSSDLIFTRTNLQQWLTLADWHYSSYTTHVASTHSTEL